MLIQFLLYNIKIIHNQIFALICLVEYSLQTLHAEKSIGVRGKMEKSKVGIYKMRI